MHPIQPIRKDKNGHLRFEQNAIVRYLLDNGGINLNDLARINFSDDDRRQFAQLIGYSLCGYSELSYVRDIDLSLAENQSPPLNETTEYIMDTSTKPNNTGYIDLTDAEVMLIKEGKELAELCSEHVDKLRATDAIDQRWVNIGTTDLQTGFMALMRSIARPNRF